MVNKKKATAPKACFTILLRPNEQVGHDIDFLFFCFLSFCDSFVKKEAVPRVCQMNLFIVSYDQTKY